MNKLKRHIIRLTAAMVLTITAVSGYAAPGWEKIAPAKEEITETVVQDGVDVRVVDGAVWIRLNGKNNVKVFTILGQLVAEQQLDAGTWRMPLTARGIYILKIGSTTRRITI